MVVAWYMDSSDADQRLPHKQDPDAPVTPEELAKTGVLCFSIDLAGDQQAQLDRIAAERSYKNRDEIFVSPEKLPNYEERIKIFFQEHLHEDEEIRFCKAGSGYFDVRDVQDRWIRIAVTPGDLIVLPAGIYHRFTLDTNNYIHSVRLFKEEPKWTPINRPADDNPFRVAYKEAFVTSQ